MHIYCSQLHMTDRPTGAARTHLERLAQASGSFRCSTGLFALRRRPRLACSCCRQTADMKAAADSDADLATLFTTIFSTLFVSPPARVSHASVARLPFQAIFLVRYRTEKRLLFLSRQVGGAKSLFIHDCAYFSFPSRNH